MMHIPMISASAETQKRAPKSREVPDPLDWTDLAESHIALSRGNPVWLHRTTRRDLQTRLASLRQSAEAGASLPLLGVPFAVKDNIDVAGLPTTAACPAFSYRADATAPVVQRVLDAGAVCLGKTNMDQFATGLVGTRSPHGPVRNALHADYIAGGSSSGSAVAVALGMASFAFGTDTAGSGRVPAALNGLVGFKPSRGSWSTRGVVPACRSLDCVSVFTRTVADARTIDGIVRGFDPADSFSRKAPARASTGVTAPPRLGVPSEDVLHFDDEESRDLYWRAVCRCEELGWELVEFDLDPFLRAAELLYQGPWVAERYAALGTWMAEHQGQMDPVVERIILQGRQWSAYETFRSLHRLQDLRREAETGTWMRVDALILPTVPGVYRIKDVLANPVELNTRLGTYTNFVNLMDLCAVSLPSGAWSHGVPFGVTLMAPAFRDDALLDWSAQFLGEPAVPAASEPPPKTVLAVVGAHLRGQPLHHQLEALQAEFVGQTQTASVYRLYALKATVPPKPGMIRDDTRGAPVEVELYALDDAAFGRFVARVPSPLCIGNVELADGRVVKGFLCEPDALRDCEEITQLGGWRRYLAG